MSARLFFSALWPIDFSDRRFLHGCCKPIKVSVDHEAFSVDAVNQALRRFTGGTRR
jgi:hypothetical protein